MKWLVVGAVLVVLVGFVGLRLVPEQRVVIGGAEVNATTAGANEKPWIIGTRTPRVRNGHVSLLVHCGRADPCRGTAALFPPSPGLVYDQMPFDMAPGENRRLRFRVPKGPLLTPIAKFGTTAPDGWTGYVEIKLRR